LALAENVYVILPPPPSAPRPQKLKENNLKLVGAVSNLKEGCFAAKHKLKNMHKYSNLWSVLAL
jgi:hypothetical protein